MRRRQFLAMGSAAGGLALAGGAAGASEEAYPVTRTDAEWRALLAPAAYAVLRENATEAAYSHPYHDLMAAGTYHCAGCAAPVYASEDKFASGTGWPAFDRAVEGQVIEGPDPVYGAFLPEVHCATCGGHMGHVFADGPKETTGRRHCINGAGLEFRAA